MYFNKIETTSNFRFGVAEAKEIELCDCGDNVFRISLANTRWPRGTDSIAQLDVKAFASQPSQAQLSLGTAGELSLSLAGEVLLESEPGRGLGLCANKWLFACRYRKEDRFYGMGEKNIGFELSGKRTQFWNTDVFADFHMDQIENGATDPMYASFPVLIIKTRQKWVGVLVNNPYAVFMNTGASEWMFHLQANCFTQELFFGSRNGAPEVWLIAAHQPDELVRKLQTLQGRTPLPPLWALGHHQSRWGYKSAQDLRDLADNYDRYRIPNDGLWLDIDYMDGYRVFTTNSEQFPDMAESMQALRERGYRVVPILDPGLRRDPDYAVYAEAKRRDILCKTPEGNEFIGFVWPGYTVFPDFSLEKGREFWAEQVAEFTAQGFSGYWIDMNDPSTGSVPLDDMSFSHGNLPHEAWHNQYALGMAIATREGIERAHPDERAFLLSRSAFLSASRHTALWTGDNLSNPHHMRGSIALSLNLSVSGMPFNGPDVPGFAGAASAELMRAWYKLGFLFPFLRNHNLANQPVQEPWTRDTRTTRIVADYIRLRYKLLPYLYNLFVAQSEQGEAILRPIWYHDPAPSFDYTEDMFFVGPAILQAPFTDLTSKSRKVTLPCHTQGKRWYNVQAKEFASTGDTLACYNTAETTPFFLASPSMIPMQTGIRYNNDKNIDKLDVLLTLEESNHVSYRYCLDDGKTIAYQSGARSIFDLEAHAHDGKIYLTITNPQRGHGGIKLRFLILCPHTPESIRLGKRELTGRKTKLKLAGVTIEAIATEWVSA